MRKNSGKWVGFYWQWAIICNNGKVNKDSNEDRSYNINHLVK